MLFNDPVEKFAWFPESILITDKRLDEAVFEGRKGMKALELDTVSNGQVGQVGST